MSENYDMLASMTGEMLSKLDEYARKKENERRRAAYRANPERARQNRINSAVNLLTRDGYIVRKPDADDIGEAVKLLQHNGYTVIHETLPPLPWDDVTVNAIGQAVKANLEAREGRAQQ